MSKDEISFKNRDRFIQMGIAISSLRTEIPVVTVLLIRKIATATRKTRMMLFLVADFFSFVAGLMDV